MSLTSDLSSAKMCQLWSEPFWWFEMYRIWCVCEIVLNWLSVFCFTNQPVLLHFCEWVVLDMQCKDCVTKLWFITAGGDLTWMHNSVCSNRESLQCLIWKEWDAELPFQGGTVTLLSEWSKFFWFDTEGVYYKALPTLSYFLRV